MTLYNNFLFVFHFSFNSSEFNFDITMQSLLGADKFGGGVTTWLVNNVRFAMEGPWTYIWPLLSLKLFISFIFSLELGFLFFMLVVWLLLCFEIWYISKLLWRPFIKSIWRLIQIVKYELKI